MTRKIYTLLDPTTHGIAEALRQRGLVPNTLEYENAYQRAWTELNREKRRANQRRYDRAHAAEKKLVRAERKAKHKAARTLAKG